MLMPRRIGVLVSVATAAAALTGCCVCPPVIELTSYAFQLDPPAEHHLALSNKTGHDLAVLPFDNDGGGPIIPLAAEGTTTIPFDVFTLYRLEPSYHGWLMVTAEAVVKPVARPGDAAGIQYLGRSGADVAFDVKFPNQEEPQRYLIGLGECLTEGSGKPPVVHEAAITDLDEIELCPGE